MDFVSIDRAGLSGVECVAANALEHNLLSLQVRAQGFRDTLGLYLHVRERKRQGVEEFKVAWTQIAGRNGAIEAQGFADTMAAVNSINAPTIWAKMDAATKRTGTKLFAREFPNIAGIRNSTAHPELATNPNEVEKHRMTEAGQNAGWIIGAESGLFISDSMTAHDDRLVFSASFKGRLASYELSEAKAAILDEVAQLFRAAFYPAEDPISVARRATV